jgi:hypothetical protein
VTWTQDDIEKIRRDIEDARSRVARTVEEVEERPRRGEVQDTVGGAVDQSGQSGHVQDTAGQQSTYQGGQVVGQVQDTAGQVQDTAGQAVDQVQDTTGGAVDQVSEVASGLAPGTQALGDPTTDEEGNTVQRTVDEEGNLVEVVLDQEGNIIDERLVGNAADLPAAEGYEVTTDEQGNKTTTVTDESGALLKLQLGPDGSVLNLELPPSTETTETVEDSSYGYYSDPRQGEEGYKEERARVADIEEILRATETMLRSIDALLAVTLGECRLATPYAPIIPVIDTDGTYKWCCTHPDEHCRPG